jgi:hypothetical protein
VFPSNRLVTEPSLNTSLMARATSGANAGSTTQSTLAPGAPGSEWSHRWVEYSGNTLKGIALGGVIGQGTGNASVGKQYLLGGASDSAAGLYAVEDGYGGVAVEWGIIGLTFWVIWTCAWLARLVSRTRQARPHPALIAAVLYRDLGRQRDDATIVVTSRPQ